MTVTYNPTTGQWMNRTLIYNPATKQISFKGITYTVDDIEKVVNMPGEFYTGKVYGSRGIKFHVSWRASGVSPIDWKYPTSLSEVVKNGKPRVCFMASAEYVGRQG